MAAFNRWIHVAEKSNITLDEEKQTTSDKLEDIYLKVLNVTSWHQWVKESGNEGIKVFTSITSFITLIGLIANLTTLVILISNGRKLPMIGRILLTHQATVDSFVCLMAIGIYSQPFMWMTKQTTFDFLLCQVWHGQAIYWGAVLLSVWNIVFISFERFMLIKHPIRHRNIRQVDIWMCFAITYILSILFLIPAYLFVKYDFQTGGCLDQYYIDGDGFRRFMSLYGVFWFFIVYAIPIVILITLHTMMKLKLRERQKQRSEWCQRKILVLDNADHQITKTAIIIAVVFIFSLGWDAFYCLFGFTGFIQYEFNTPLQITGVFLATFDSCSTPFIYAASMPLFRSAAKKTFQCKNNSNVHYL